MRNPQFYVAGKRPMLIHGFVEISPLLSTDGVTSSVNKCIINFKNILNYIYIYMCVCVNPKHRIRYHPFIYSDRAKAMSMEYGRNSKAFEYILRVGSDTLI